MEKISIEDFKNQSNIEIVKELMKINNGYITSKLVSELGIHRMYLNIMVKRNILKKINSGVYIDINKTPDYYYALYLNLPGIVYSHLTALYFHGLSNIEPNDIYDITTKKNYNNIKLKKHNIFYVPDDIYKLGLIDVKTPLGNIVKAYDIERCICDIVKSKKRIDIKQYKYSIKEYFKRKEVDINKLNKYAKKLSVEKKINDLVELLYE